MVGVDGDCQPAMPIVSPVVVSTAFIQCMWGSDREGRMRLARRWRLRGSGGRSEGGSFLSHQVLGKQV